MSSSHISFKTLKAKHEEDVAVLLKKYAEDETLSKFVQYTEKDKSVFVDTYLKLSVNGLSYGLFEDETGMLVGIVINSVPSQYKEFGGFETVGKKLSSKSEKLLRFESYMEEGTTDFLGSDNYMTSELGYTLQAYRRRSGMAKRVWDRNVAIARKLNIDGILTVMNSNTLAEKSLTSIVGFLPLRRVYYKDYRDPVTGEAIFAGLPSSSQHYQYATQMIMLCKRAKF